MTENKAGGGARTGPFASSYETLTNEQIPFVSDLSSFVDTHVRSSFILGLMHERRFAHGRCQTTPLLLPPNIYAPENYSSGVGGGTSRGREKRHGWGCRRKVRMIQEIDHGERTKSEGGE